jgi:molecular chaperone DnaK
MDDETKKKLEEKASELKTIIPSENIDDIKKKMEELETIIQEFTTKLYQKAAQEQQQEANKKPKTEKPKKENSKDKVVDGEFEEKK